MPWAHIHLLTNHLPVLGAPALLALLVWGLVRRSREITRVALWCTVLLAAVSEGVFLTGDAAEEQIENRPGFNERRAEEHEGQAGVANIAMIATGVIAAVALWRGRRDPVPAGPLPRIVVAALIINTGLFAATGWTGGRIGHPELQSGAAPGGVRAGRPDTVSQHP